MTAADITPGYSGHPCRASGFRPDDLRALGVVGRRRARRVDRGRHADRQQLLGHDRIMALNAFFEQLGFMAGFPPCVGYGGAYAASTILNGSTPFHRGFP